MRNIKIKPSYVSFEQARLLKEKGFDEDSDYNQWILAKDVNSKDESKKFICHSNDLEEYTYINEEKEHNVYHCLAIPEHHVVVEWLRVNHGICVHTKPENNEKDEVVWQFVILIILDNEVCFKKRQSEFNTPQEAYSAAFDYVLTNLI